MNFYLIRHPQPDVPQSICYGKTDVGLFDINMPMANELAKQIPTDAIVYSSPLQRCYLLADKICKIIGKDFIVDKRITEFDFGDYEMRVWSELPKEVFSVWDVEPLKFRTPGGESFGEFASRVNRFYEKIGKQNNHNVVLLTHSGVLKVSDYLLNKTKINTAMAKSYEFATMYKFSNSTIK